MATIEEGDHAKVVTEKLRDTGVRVEQLAERMINLDRQLQDVDRRLIRIEACVEIGKTRQPKLPRKR